MAFQVADHRRSRAITAALVGGALAAGFALSGGAGVAHADDPVLPPPTTEPVSPAAIVPNGVTGEAAKAAKAGQAPVPAPAQADPAAPVSAPAGPTDPAAAAIPAGPVEMTADQALLIIQRDYDIGASGGQLSTLVEQVLKLRAKGFKASEANRRAIVKAFDYRPNQGPLIAALKDTLAYQLKQKSLMEAAQGGQSGGPMTIGINQYDPDNPGALGQFTFTPGS